MSQNHWTWKAKDGAVGGLLYEPGNWGDLLKASWLATVVVWARTGLKGGIGKFIDPFAGAPAYPLGKSTEKRYAGVSGGALAVIGDAYVANGAWPSSAALFRLLSSAPMVVFDADGKRSALWRGMPDAVVAAALDGWNVVAEEEPGDRDLILIDPYDFLADWREKAEDLLDRVRSATTLVYVYNRSAQKSEYFKEYRAFRGFLDERTGGGHLLGRVGSDSFLPNSHHEMFLLPGPAVCESPEYGKLAAALESATLHLDAVMRRLAVFQEKTA